jgi:hypothetical protein
MTFTLQELHDEIETDSEGLGYKEAGGDWKSDSVIADLINDPVGGDTIERRLVTPKEIIEQITISDWDVLSTSDRLYLQLLPSLEWVSAKQGITEVRDNLLDIFTIGMVTRDNLISVIQRQGSRAEVLWGESTFVSIGNVAHSANL